MRLTLLGGSTTRVGWTSNTEDGVWGPAELVHPPRPARSRADSGGCESKAHHLGQPQSVGPEQVHDTDSIRAGMNTHAGKPKPTQSYPANAKGKRFSSRASPCGPNASTRGSAANAPPTIARGKTRRLRRTSSSFSHCRQPATSRSVRLEWHRTDPIRTCSHLRHMTSRRSRWRRLE